MSVCHIQDWITGRLTLNVMARNGSLAHGNGFWNIGTTYWQIKHFLGFLKQFQMASFGFDCDTYDTACLPEAAIAEISLLEYGPIDQWIGIRCDFVGGIVVLTCRCQIVVIHSCGS